MKSQESRAGKIYIFALISKQTNAFQSLTLVDMEICKITNSNHCKQSFNHNWFSVIGEPIACNPNMPLGSIELREYLKDEDSVITKIILPYLEKNFSSYQQTV
jgi:hypothetical protein